MKNFLLILIILISSFIPFLAFAQIPNINFGGPIISSIECTCSGGLLVTIFDFKTMLPLPLYFQAGVSRLNMSFNLFLPMIFTLGTYIPGGVCLTGVACLPPPIPPIGTITPIPLSGVGTSGLPAL